MRANLWTATGLIPRRASGHVWADGKHMSSQNVPGVESVSALKLVGPP